MIWRIYFQFPHFPWHLVFGYKPLQRGRAHIWKVHNMRNIFVLNSKYTSKAKRSQILFCRISSHILCNFWRNSVPQNCGWNISREAKVQNRGNFYKAEVIISYQGINKKTISGKINQTLSQTKRQTNKQTDKSLFLIEHVSIHKKGNTITKIPQKFLSLPQKVRGLGVTRNSSPITKCKWFFPVKSLYTSFFSHFLCTMYSFQDNFFCIPSISLR